MKKFKLTTNTKVNFLGITLFQIECIVETKYAKVGDLGGWVESEEVFGNSRVSGDARVSSNADYCCFQSFGSVNRTTTVFKEKTGKLRIVCVDVFQANWTPLSNRLNKDTVTTDMEPFTRLFVKL